MMMTATESPTAACPGIHELRAFSVGERSSAESDAMFRHIAECMICQDNLEQLETMDDGDNSLVTSLRTAVQVDDSEDELCRLSLAKALGALAKAQSEPDSMLDFPERIGDYELVRPLGTGGMGNVFLARHTKLGREVALKVIADHRLADRRVRDRFENEMRAVGRLSHPGIVTAHDAREIGSTAMLVTEYIDGLDLGQVVSRLGRLGVADACEIARRVAVALQYISEQGFVHRDIKPSNIMLRHDGELKVLDLGLARFQEETLPEMTGSGQTMGTADYVSPEQVADSRDVDVRSDLYSLGCTLFKLLSGQAPFATSKHATAFAKLQAHVSEPAPRLSAACESIPKDLDVLVGELLDKDPANRPANPIGVAKRLAAFCEGADLKSLVEEAVRRPEKKAVPTSEGKESILRASMGSRKSGVEVSPFWRKPVSRWLAIAAGFFGFGLGVAFGVLVTIELSDGTKITQEYPEGTKVTVEPTKEPNAKPVPATPEVDLHEDHRHEGVGDAQSAEGDFSRSGDRTAGLSIGRRPRKGHSERGGSVPFVVTDNRHRPIGSR